MARSSRPLRRKPGAAVEAETIAIVCEGKKTEGLYFNGIRREFRITTAQLHVVELGFDPSRVVQEAESLRRDYDHVWAVFDVEAPGGRAGPGRAGPGQGGPGQGGAGYGDAMPSATAGV